jgi:hypothetical protein
MFLEMKELLARSDAKLEEFMVYLIRARKLNNFMPKGYKKQKIRYPHYAYIIA